MTHITRMTHNPLCPLAVVRSNAVPKSPHQPHRREENSTKQVFVFVFVFVFVHVFVFVFVFVFVLVFVFVGRIRSTQWNSLKDPELRLPLLG